MERTKRTNQKTENSKENRGSRELGEIRRRKRTNQKVGIKRKKKEHRSREFWGNERKKTHQSKHKKNSKKIQKFAKKLSGRPGSRPTNGKIEPRKIRSSARRRCLGIAGIGVTGRCVLKILGPFEVTYIPPATPYALLNDSGASSTSPSTSLRPKFKCLS